MARRYTYAFGAADMDVSGVTQNSVELYSERAAVQSPASGKITASVCRVANTMDCLAAASWWNGKARNEKDCSQFHFTRHSWRQDRTEAVEIATLVTKQQTPIKCNSYMTKQQLFYWLMDDGYPGMQCAEDQQIHYFPKKISTYLDIWIIQETSKIIGWPAGKTPVAPEGFRKVTKLAY